MKHGFLPSPPSLYLVPFLTPSPLLTPVTNRPVTGSCREDLTFQGIKEGQCVSVMVTLQSS